MSEAGVPPVPPVAADRSELYVGLSGRGVMILDTVDGDTDVVEVNPGQAVYVPGHWVHRSVNTGKERLATLFCPDHRGYRPAAPS